jgi:hypothetical protein
VTPGELGLIDMLETVEEFGSASLELIAWEFDVAFDTLRPLWRHAVDEHLIQPAGENEVGERNYRLATLARTWLATERDPMLREVVVCLGCATLRRAQEPICPSCSPDAWGAPPATVAGLLARLSDRAVETAPTPRASRRQAPERALLMYARAFDRRVRDGAAPPTRTTLMRARIRELERERGRDAFCVLIARRLVFGEDPPQARPALKAVHPADAPNGPQVR